MNRTYKVLSTEMDFLTEDSCQIRVSVWHVQDDRETLMDHGGTN